MIRWLLGSILLVACHGDAVVSDSDAGADTEPGVDGGDEAADAGCTEGLAYPASKGCPDRAWACWKVAGDSPTTFEPKTVCGDAVVLDKNTGLMWARAAEPGLYPWAEAKARCEGSRLGGFSDWRLPTRAELGTLIDFTVLKGPTLDLVAFPGATEVYLWTSSTYRLSAGKAYVVLFDSGNSGYNSVSLKYGARCVR